MALISVVMPVYNGMPFLKEALGSVLDQSMTATEIIVLNDASTDGTMDYLKSVRDGRLRIVSFAENQGLIKLLNEGLALATSEYVARMDADDFSLPCRFEKQVHLLDNSPGTVACGCQAVCIDAAGNRTGIIGFPTDNGSLKASLPLTVPFLHPSSMFRRSEVVAAGGYDQRFKYVEDYELWWRLASRGSFVNSPETLFHYRVHGQNVSVVRRTEQSEAFTIAAFSHLSSLTPVVNRHEFDSFFRLHCNKIGSTDDFAAYCKVVLALLEALLSHGWISRGDLVFARRYYRWRCLLNARSLGLFSRSGRCWFSLARQIDSGGMTLAKVGLRALSALWSGFSSATTSMIHRRASNSGEFG
jgi:glycosyltransferase involved in cell wall biosynthesis